MRVSVLPYGERAILVEADDLRAVLALDAVLRHDLPDSPWVDEITDLVPAARTLLIILRRSVRGDDLSAWVQERAGSIVGGTLPAITEVVTIPVVYDGPDLDNVARHTGLSASGVVAAHTHQVWRVAFGGFAPGFAYLTGDDDRLTVPRRPDPRTRVPAGSVGLAGTFSGIYPRSSPGGWQLIGRTNASLWDVDRTPPALLRPGVGVRFEVSHA